MNSSGQQAADGMAAPDAGPIVRLSIGLEDAADVIDDLDAALTSTGL